VNLVFDFSLIELWPQPLDEMLVAAALMEIEEQSAFPRNATSGIPLCAYGK
jgi:hypothetical protein